MDELEAIADRAPAAAEYWQGVYKFGSPVRALLGSRIYRRGQSVKTLLRINEIDELYKESDLPTPFKRLELFRGSRTYVFPLSSLTQNLPLGWLLSETTRKRLLLRSGNKDNCFFTRRFPPLRTPKASDRLKAFMNDHSENLAGALDNWMADCSQKSIIDKLTPTPG